MGKFGKGILIGFGVLVIIIIIFFFAVFGKTMFSNKLVCKSGSTNITIYYDDETIIGHKAINATYDRKSQATYAQQVGMEKYITEFTTYFVTTVGGTCEKK